MRVTLLIGYSSDQRKETKIDIMIAHKLTSLSSPREGTRLYNAKLHSVTRYKIYLNKRYLSTMVDKSWTLLTTNLGSDDIVTKMTSDKETWPVKRLETNKSV